MITPVVMALFQKHGSCSSNKAMTVCGEPAENLRSPTELCSRGGIFTEFKLRLLPPKIYRRTIYKERTYCYYTLDFSLFFDLNTKSLLKIKLAKVIITCTISFAILSFLPPMVTKRNMIPISINKVSTLEE